MNARTNPTLLERNVTYVAQIYGKDTDYCWESLTLDRSTIGLARTDVHETIKACPDCKYRIIRKTMLVEVETVY